ncbi:MAG: YbhN family protein [Acidimicrobiia bacterium]|nr:YbhN family protein [Acidimicrobiia bacterium]
MTFEADGGGLSRAESDRRRPWPTVPDHLEPSTPTSVFIRRTLVWGIGLAAAAVALYFMQDQLRDLLSSSPRLRTIRPGWFAVMFVLELASFACLWWLTRIVLPRVSWFVAASSQLVSNAVSRVIPGGAATGGAIYYRMLSSAGVDSAKAGGALAVTSVMTTAALVAIPAVAGLMALLGAPIPESLLPAAVAGAVMFVVLLAVGAVAISFSRPLRVAEAAFRAIVEVCGRLVDRPWSVGEGRFMDERDRLVEVVGSRWPAVITASAGKWAFDYLTLIAALYSVGAEPRLSLVLIAYAGAQVLGMIPITPGGLGFVEVGLYSLLIISGISAQDASLATIAYRLLSWWVPIVTGFGAWLLFVRRNQIDEPATAKAGVSPETYGVSS